MAFTEKYVSVAGAGAHDGSSEANAWTLAEGLTNAAAGDRVNVIKGAYSSGADSVTNAGTTQQAIVFRGYNSSIGDLTGARTSGNGELDVTNYPVATLTGLLTISELSFFESVKITGGISSELIGTSFINSFGLINCVVINTGNNASSRAISCNNYCRFSNCDFECSGASHASVFDADQSVVLENCRLKSVANDCATVQFGKIDNNIFFGASDDSGIVINFSAGFRNTAIRQNTFYNLDTAIFAATTSQEDSPLLVVNNFASDCSKWIDCAFVATANQPIIEINNWLYNITTPRTGVSDFPVVGEISGSGVDGAFFEDAAGGDFNLISGAPGRAAGLWPFRDIGALQHEDAGGGGGGMIVHPGMTGGMRG